MSNEDKTKPIFRKPEAEQPNPVSDIAAYFAYWEAQRIERLKRERIDEDSLSVYERSRRHPREWGW